MKQNFLNIVIYIYDIFRIFFPRYLYFLYITNTVHKKNICIHILLHKGKIWNAYKIHILGYSVFLTCCFVRINNVIEDSVSLFSSTFCYLYKYLIHQLSYTQVPFHQTKLPEELHGQLLKQFLSYPSPSQWIYSRSPIIDYLFNLEFALIPISRHCSFDQTKSVHDASSRSRVTHNTHTYTHKSASYTSIRTILYTSTT